MMGRPENPKVKGSVAAGFTPADSPLTFEDVMESHADLATPDVTVGEVAFDFDLPVFDFSSGFRDETGRSFHLQEVARNQPVALLFGSYT